ncbi:hypothetical protein AS888_05955 [Peribacillus simplex]|uniref:Uncharacterized protein n=1 Tax=Peribacillus simplex TaxID=1478 RepID=A0A109N237_9BACI|nr:hypothetical protein [Peribacillus simplex]KWW22076.1 hypothetical protein AS888_05955 [Peribacillus simplex]
MDVESLIKRKITVTYVTTAVTSFIFVYLYMADGMKEGTTYNLGGEFLRWVFLYSMYVGAIVLIYGTLVSVVIEYLQRRWFIKHTWLYILLHGLFGLLNGLFFQETSLVIAGMVAALFYAFIDRWLYVRDKAQQTTKLFLLFPPLACGLLCVYFQIISEPLPPFSTEDAVEFATDGEGTFTEVFPKYVGKVDEMIHGYHVERETSAKGIGKEKYLITFTERWNKGKEKGFWSFSYEVERKSLTAYDDKGTYPPYYQ